MSDENIKTNDEEIIEVIELTEEWDDLLIFLGGGIKTLGDGRVGGYLVRFSDPLTPDLEGDFFTKETNFALHDAAKSYVYYDHGLDSHIGKKQVGAGDLSIHEDVGVWIEAQLHMRDEYERAIYALADEGKLGWSSGTSPSLVERKQVGSAKWIKQWPLGVDASLTPIPAEPRNMAMTIKNYAKINESLTAVLRGAGEARRKPDSDKFSDNELAFLKTMFKLALK